MSNEDVLADQVPWMQIQAAGIISKEQLQVVYELDKQPVDAQLAKIAKMGSSWVETIAALIAGCSKEEWTLYVLAMLDTLLTAKPELAADFHAVLFSSGGKSDPIECFVKLLSQSGVCGKGAYVGAKVMTASYPAAAEGGAAAALAGHIAVFSEWLVTCLKSCTGADVDSPKLAYALTALQSLVSSNPGRVAVVAADGLPALVGLMGGSSFSSHPAIQMLYKVLFSLWNMSYSSEAALVMVTSKLGLVAKIVDIVKTVQKEKVVRVGIATLKNLLNTATASADMVGAGMMKILEHLQQRKWADEDIVVDLDVLAAALAVNLQSMSSWDVYVKEVSSGRLEWSPSHKSENFWKDNYRAFEAHDFAVCKQLIGLLASEDPTTLAVASHDIAEFIKVHPEGRRLMAAAKPAAMKLLSFQDPDVQKYALTAVQRLMVINWEFLHKG